MVNYNQSIIYKICCKDPLITDIYIGSTTNFKRRKYEHKAVCITAHNKKYNAYVYQFIRSNGNWENWDMIMVEEFKCNNKLELEKRERYWVDELKASLNKRIPNQTLDEWKEINKEKIAKKIKEYKINNKDKIKEYNEKNKEKIAKKNKEWREQNKDKIKEQKKEYNEKNKEKIAKKKKEWREQNKEKIAEKKKEYGEKKITCEKCNIKIRKDCYNRHLKTQLHKNNM